MMTRLYRASEGAGGLDLAEPALDYCIDQGFVSVCRDERTRLRVPIDAIERYQPRITAANS